MDKQQEVQEMDKQQEVQEINKEKEEKVDEDSNDSQENQPNKNIKKILIRNVDKHVKINKGYFESQESQKSQDDTYNKILIDQPSQLSLYYKLDSLNPKKLNYVRNYMMNTYGLSKEQAKQIGSDGSVFTYGPSLNSMPLIPDDVNKKTYTLTFSFGDILGGVVGIFKGIVRVQQMEAMQKRNGILENLYIDFSTIWKKALDIGKTVINGTQKALLMVNGVVNQAEKIGKIFSYDNSQFQGEDDGQISPFNNFQIGLQTGWCAGNFETRLQSTGQVKQCSYKQYNQARNICAKPAFYNCRIDFDFKNPNQSKRGMPILLFEEVPQTNKLGKILNKGSLASGAICMIE